MNASIHSFGRVPEHLSVDEKPHLVGKQICLKYGKLMYKLFIGENEGSLVLRIHLTSRYSKPVTIDWYNPHQASKLPTRIFNYAKTWFEDLVSPPPQSPDFHDQMAVPVSDQISYDTAPIAASK